MFKQCLTQQTKIGTMAPCNWYMLNHYLYRLIYNYPNVTHTLTLHRLIYNYPNVTHTNTTQTPIQTMNIYKQLLCFRPCLKPN